MADCGSWRLGPETAREGSAVGRGTTAVELWRRNADDKEEEVFPTGFGVPESGRGKLLVYYLDDLKVHFTWRVFPYTRRLILRRRRERVERGISFIEG